MNYLLEGEISSDYLSTNSEDNHGDYSNSFYYDDKIIDTIKLSINSRKNFKPYVDDYMVKNVSQKVVNIIQSYIKIINNKVWKKNEF